MSPSDRPTFTKDQLTQYFDYIDLPSNVRQQLTSSTPSKSLTPETQLTLLTTLLHHQLTTVPFENLDLHYSPVKGISLNIHHLFNKVVERRAGRGGYCMQNNSFFATVLRSLGYIVMSAGGRVATNYGSPDAGREPLDDVSYGAFTHQVNIVTIRDTKYFVDCGFGGAGPTRPVPLVDGYTAVQTGTEANVAASLRLSHGFTGNNTARTPEQMVWRYTVKYGSATDAEKPWVPVYCFTEMEFMPHDFELSSAWVSTSRSSIFVNMIMMQKFLRGEGDDDRDCLVGELTVVDGVFKERRYGVSKVLRECKSEEERVDALERFMGVKLSLGEREGIKGYHTEIK